MNNGLGLLVITSLFLSLGSYAFEDTAVEVTVERYSGKGELLDESSLFFYEVFKSEYITNIKELNKYTIGAIEKRPYLDSWYPEKEGGTNMFGALDKYDSAFYQSPKTANWESTYHGEKDEKLDWYGHCNGYSASVARHQNPERSVVRPVDCDSNPAVSCVTFEPKHIRGLLAEVYMSAKSRFLGGSRCRKENSELAAMGPRELRADPTKMDECDDINPGILHTALVNWMGIKKQTLIFDYNKDAAVWNYPIYKYEIKYENGGRPLTAREAYREVVLHQESDRYIFNPMATSFYKVSLDIYFAKVHSNPAHGGYKIHTYTYILELDSKENVVGGEWTGDSKMNHPDFLWIPFEPFDPPGTRELGNPFVNKDEVIKIWAESVGFNPEDPFNDPNNKKEVLFSPKSSKNWGKFSPFFQLTLDGTNSGAVFLGKKIKLSVARETRLHGNVKLELSLNGKVVSSSQATGDKDIEFEINPEPGMNTLGFKWWVDNRLINLVSKKVRFYAM